MMRGFDPEFDDTTWSDAWHLIPIRQVPPGEHPGGYRVESRILTDAEVFGRAYRLAEPMACSLLYDPDGTLWMSNTPQERIMMYNNGLRSWGRVLVGGLGLGLYPQYAVIGAAGEAASFTIVEESATVRAIVEPVVRQAVGVPVEVHAGRIEDWLDRPPGEPYDTIFLDTWATLDAAALPEINALRDRAIPHLSEQGRVLLWGYRWMVRLFEDACRQLLSLPRRTRSAWLDAQTQTSPQAAQLLMPVLERFAGADLEGLEPALAWCRQHIVERSAPPGQ